MEKEWQPLPPPKMTTEEIRDKYGSLMALPPERRDELCERAVMLGIKEGWCKPYIQHLGRLARTSAEAYWVLRWLGHIDVLTAKPKAREIKEETNNSTENENND